VRPKTVLFCGTRSRYGLAHLSPALELFDIAAVVMATDQRWRLFEKRLSGPRSRATSPIHAARHALYEARSRFRQLTADWKLQRDLKRRGVKVLRAADANDPAFIRALRDLAPDVLLCAAYPQILSNNLISIPRRASINFHPSALPKYRGAHPHFWAIAKGEATGGVTAHLMTERIDDGDIVAQVTFPIEGDYYEDYYRKIVAETPRLVAEVLRFVTDPDSRPVRQDAAAATFFKNDKETDWRILWPDMSARDVYNLIRTERAFCFFRSSSKVQVARAELILQENDPSVAGTILRVGDAIIVRSNNGAIAIKAFGYRGNLIPAGSWARELHVSIGEKFS
jgi:methionyl-tRNA formyltransferase